MGIAASILGPRATNEQISEIVNKIMSQATISASNSCAGSVSGSQSQILVCDASDSLAALIATSPACLVCVQQAGSNSAALAQCDAICKPCSFVDNSQTSYLSFNTSCNLQVADITKIQTEFDNLVKQSKVDTGDITAAVASVLQTALGQSSSQINKNLTELKNTLNTTLVNSVMNDLRVNQVQSFTNTDGSGTFRGNTQQLNISFISAAYMMNTAYTEAMTKVENSTQQELRTQFTLFDGLFIALFIILIIVVIVIFFLIIRSILRRRRRNQGGRTAG